MAQLFYRYSTMNAGKSLELIKVAYNYEERGKKVLTLVPEVSSGGKVGKVVSRVGIDRDATVFSKGADLLKLFIEKDEALFAKEHAHIDIVLIDEGQFLMRHHVEELTEIVDSLDVPVMVYGLKNDFRNELFEGSKYLLIYADKIDEIKSICWCGKKATMVARLGDGGKVTKEGEQVLLGGNERYVALCRKHYNDGRIGEEDTRPK
jgi:thymidine kinase